jgi:hypothetical protein
VAIARSEAIAPLGSVLLPESDPGVQDHDHEDDERLRDIAQRGRQDARARQQQQHG